MTDFALEPLEQPRVLTRLVVVHAGIWPDGVDFVELECGTCGYNTGEVPERGKIEWECGRDAGGPYLTPPCPKCNDPADIEHNKKIRRLLT